MPELFRNRREPVMKRVLLLAAALLVTLLACG